MPNWCSNQMTIKGRDKSDILEIIKILNHIETSENKEIGIFHSLVGYDKDYTEEEIKNNSYNINIDSWGTKWDIVYDSCQIDYESYHKNPKIIDTITMSFETAWSPPINFGKKLAKKYKVLVTLYYHESGSDFCGKTYCYSNGNIETFDYPYLEGLYNFDEEYFWDELKWQLEYYIENESSYVDFASDFHYLSTSTKQSIYYDKIDWHIKKAKSSELE